MITRLRYFLLTIDFSIQLCTKPALPFPYSTNYDCTRKNSGGRRHTKQQPTINRVAVLGLGIVGIILSWVGSRTCEFLSFENSEGVPWRELEPPFDTAIAANVGIFNYEILDSPNADDITDGCIAYDDNFFGLVDTQEALAAAQICAVVAPVLAGVSLLLNLMEACFCNFPGSFVFTSTLFIAASGVQAGTFSMIAEPSLWCV